MTPLPKSAAPISPAQVQRLQALWHHWTARLGLEPEADRRLRHYYVELFSGGRAAETKQLTRADAARVIAWLELLSRRRARAENQAAGTAGRHGFPERRQVRPNAAAWRALWAVAGALGMNRQKLNEFIRNHYESLGLGGTGDLRTMADLNRVLWGLKAILRRGPRPRYAAATSDRKVA